MSMVFSVSKNWKMAFTTMKYHVFFPEDEQSWFFGSYESPAGISWKHPVRAGKKCVLRELNWSQEIYHGLVV